MVLLFFLNIFNAFISANEIPKDRLMLQGKEVYLVLSSEDLGAWYQHRLGSSEHLSGYLTSW